MLDQRLTRWRSGHRNDTLLCHAPPEHSSVPVDLGAPWPVKLDPDRYDLVWTEGAWRALPPSRPSPSAIRPLLSSAGKEAKHLQSHRREEKPYSLESPPSVVRRLQLPQTVGRSCLSPGDCRHGTQHFQERWKSQWSAHIPGAEIGSNLSNYTSGFHLGATIVTEADPSFHDCSVPEKFRDDSRALSSSPSLQNTCLYAAGPDFQTSACQVIISFSPRDPILESEGSVHFSHLRKGTSLGTLKGAWEEAELAGCWSSGCPGLGHVRPDDCLPLVSDGPAWMGMVGGGGLHLSPPRPGPPGGQRQTWATCQYCPISAAYTFQSPCISAKCAPLGPFLMMPSSWTVSWIIKFTSNKILGRGSPSNAPSRR